MILIPADTVKSKAVSAGIALKNIFTKAM